MSDPAYLRLAAQTKTDYVYQLQLLHNASYSQQRENCLVTLGDCCLSALSHVQVPVCQVGFPLLLQTDQN